MTAPTSESAPRGELRRVLPFALASAAVAVATGLTLAFHPFLSAAPFALYYLAVLVSTAEGGASAGAFAVALSLVAADFFLLVPIGRPSLGTDDVVALLVAGAVGAAIVALVHRVRLAIRDADARRAEVERLSRLYDALSQVNQAIVWSDTRDELLTKVCRVLVERGGFQMAWIGWEEPATCQLVPVAQWGDREGYLTRIRVFTDDRPEGRGPSGRAFRTGRPTVTNDVGTDPATLPWRTEAARSGFRSAAVFPVRRQGEVCAVLSVYAGAAAFFREQETALIEEAATDISYALDNFDREAERRRAEAAADRERRLVDMIMESLPGVLYLYDEEGRFLRWNRRFLEVTGYTAEELARMRPLDFFRGEDVSRVSERIGRVFSTGEGTVEAGFVSKAGDTIPYFFTGRRIELDGRPCLVGVGIDISERVRAEAELRRSEERYHSTLDSIAEGAQLIGRDWRYLYLNDAAARHNRRPNAELLGRTMPDAWPGIEGTRVYALLRRCLEERVAAHEEIEFAFADGVSRWYDVRAQPVPEGVFVLSIDVTDRRAAEVSARELQSQFELVVENLREGLVIADRDGTRAHWNPAALRLIGFDDVEEGRRLQDDFPALFEIRALDGSPLPPERWPLARVRSGETLDDLEVRVGRRDRDWERIVSYAGTRVTYGEGRALAFMTMRDVTERRRLEAERDRLLAEEQAARTRVDQILESVTDAFVTLDRDWRYIYVNERAARIFGRTRESLLGRHIWTEFPEGVGQPFHRAYERAMHDRVEVQFEEYYPPYDAWFENRIYPSADGISIVFQDITARKKGEQALLEAKADLERKVEERTAELQGTLVRAEAADRIKSAFLATMSHELRTPLNSIIGFTGIILQELAGPLNAEQQKQLGMVRGSARHLLDLINDVLDISKIEAGQLEVRMEPVDLRAAIERAVAAVRPMTDQKGLTLEARLPPDLPPIRSDRRRVDQVLLNLVNNAAKFTDRGGVTVAADAGPGVTLSGKPGVRIQVTDTGIGIKPADLATLFQPFRQLDTGLTREHEGTGLGLAICRRLTELLGGEIRAESTWGAGSIFTVTLPLEPGS